MSLRFGCDISVRNYKYKKVLDNLFQGLNNEEKLALDNILVSNSDFIYLVKKIFEFTKNIQHEMKTANHRPVFTKMYRYPHVHGKDKQKTNWHYVKTRYYKGEQFAI